MLPRFLFRAFGRWSGGGYDPRLNSADGVVPHGFLCGKKPTSIYDIPDLGRMVTAHLENSYNVKSDFSSWAADYQIATRYGSESTHVAILDTTLLEDHVKIYHVPEFVPAGDSRGKYDHEYLAYGPIHGPAFHVVARKDMKRAGLYELCPPGGRGLNPKRPLASDMDKLVGIAKRVAALFRPASDPRPDITIALTVSFAALTYVDWQGHPDLDQSFLQNARFYLAEELKHYGKTVAS